MGLGSANSDPSFTRAVHSPRVAPALRLLGSGDNSGTQIRSKGGNIHLGSFFIQLHIRQYELRVAV